jgi:MFS family permease
MRNRAGFAAIARALRNPNYGAYTAGSGASLIGTWMQRVAVGWLAWELTGSGAWLGAIAFADLFPTILVGPLAGVLADRWDRLKVIRVAQVLALLQSLALFALTATGTITIGLLLALTLFLGIVAGMNQPARMALIPSLVPREDLSAAVAINSILFNAARFIGPAAAGAMIVTGGTASAFAVNAVTFAVFLLTLARVRLPAAPRPARTAGVLEEMAAGMRYVAGHPGMGPMLLLLLATCLFVRPVVELLPGFAADVFGTGADGLALLTSTVGAGAVLGGLWLAGRGDTDGLTRIALANTALLALAILIFVATDSLWVAVPALLAAGGGMVVAGVGAQTLIQLSIQGSMRGRVMSLYGLIFRAGPALGALAIGIVSEETGLRWPVAAGTLLTLAACLLAWSRRERMAAALEHIPDAGTAD